MNGKPQRSVEVAEPAEGVGPRDSFSRYHVSIDLSRRCDAILKDRSNSEVGAACGLSRESIRRYRSGDMPSPVLIAWIIDHLGVDANWLFTGRGWRYRQEGAEAILGCRDRGQLKSLIESKWLPGASDDEEADAGEPDPEGQTISRSIRLASREDD